MAELFQQLKDQGQLLGLEGEKLLTYVTEQQAILRDERRKDRELKEKEREREENEKERQREREREIENEKERMEKEREREENERQRAHELELKRLEMENATNNNGIQTSHKGPAPKLPVFNDKIDNIDTYLYRFEIHAKTMNWSETVWSSYLAALLQGKSLEYFRELPYEDTGNYQKLKSLLIRRFAWTQDTYREKFRESRPEPTEDFSAFLSRITSYLNRWVQMANSEKSFQKLFDLILMEQIHNSCHKDLVTFLRENNPQTIEALTKLANTYRDAHPNKPLAKSHTPDFFTASAVTKPSRFNQTETNYNQPQMPRRAGSFPPKPRLPTSMIQCYTCGKTGHKSSQCYFNPQNQNANFQRPIERNQNLNFQRSTEHNQNQNFNFQRSTERNQNENTNYQRSTQRNQNPNFYRNHHLTQTNRPNQYNQRPHTASLCVENNEENTTCQNCNKMNTPGTQIDLSCGHTLPVFAATHDISNLPIYQGLVNSRYASVLRDTGATCIGVSKHLVQQSQLTGKSIKCILFTGAVVTLPLANITIQTPFFSGDTQACVLDNPVADVIIGNVPGAKFPPIEEINNWLEQNIAAAVKTRAQSKKQTTKPLLTSPIDITKDNNLAKLQKEDISLANVWSQFEKGISKSTKRGTAQFQIIDKALYRVFNNGETYKQLVLPKILVPDIISFHHDTPTGGHMGIDRTKKRILNSFYWPSLHRDVSLFCRSCDICQRTVPAGKIGKVPNQPTPFISTPLEKVSVDLIGPIFPPSDRGHRFALTFVDDATRWPEAIPLRDITASSVAEALFSIFTRLGCPKIILSDQGTQFMSNVMRELYSLLGIHHIHTSPYHAQANGKCERWNGTLKAMLKRVAADSPRDWDRYVPAVLWAYRELPHETTGFSPYYLLFGRPPRGPSAILQEILTNTKPNLSNIPITEYVSDLSDKINSALQIAKENSVLQTQRTRKQANKNKILRTLEPKDSVLLLLPKEKNKLLMSWQGPYKVIKRTSEVNYLIDIKGKPKIFHINMLKHYTPRPENLKLQNSFHTIGMTAVINEEQASAPSHPNQCQNEPIALIPTVTSAQEQSVNHINVNDDLSEKQKLQINQLLQQFQSTFTNIPGKTNALSHEIHLNDTKPINIKPYPIPLHLRDTFLKELQDMKELGVIEPSTSNFSSPAILIKKPDGSVRFCIDYRQLNSITIMDREPIPNPDEIIDTVANSIYFTKLDLTKGYWQLPMHPDHKHYTAFQTPLGLYQWTYMPFGLCNAPATFARFMRIMLHDLPNVISFFDDILVHSPTWDEHLQSLFLLFSRLAKYNITAKPSKVFIAYKSISFLGYTISHGNCSPQTKKVLSIRNLATPQTKKQVRSILGLLNYYRKFIPNFSTLAAPLSDLTKAGAPNKVIWSEHCQASFDQIKSLLSQPPILALPDLSQNFILRTDASDVGIGASLLQEHNGTLHPVIYVSRKLLQREQNYSIIERELLAIIWAVHKLSRYLLGQQFIIQTDHKALKYLQKQKSSSAKLNRYFLLLSEFSFEVQHIPGSSNQLADTLSRLA